MSFKLAGYIDHTLLKPEATGRDIVKLCKEAVEYSFYAVCINPSYVNTAVKELQGSPVKVCAVVGFPLGVTSTTVKAFEAVEAVDGGAEEIDMVIHVGALKEGSTRYVIDDLSAVVKAVKGKTVKVIIETGLLDKEEKITACRLVKESGAGFVKTSTGFGPGGATIADIQLMRETVGPDLGVKASGGIRTAKAAREMIEAGADRIGTSSGIAIIQG
ncbi:MAG: deoxyribose-phosphate aldolase [Bacillota bacterium]